MRPATVFAGLVGLLSIALLASGYLVPALLAAVFAALVFVSRAMSPDRGRHDSDGYVPDASSAVSSTGWSSDSSTWSGGRDDNDRDMSNRCDDRSDDRSDDDVSNDCDAGGDSGGDSGGDGGGSD